MAHAIYITDAIVCGSKLHNTADKVYLLFTRELGMLWATARSVREERSRQRYALQDFSLIRVSLIKGKSGWRIGSTEALGNPFLSAKERVARGGVTYLIKMLRRYVQGEQTMVLVFDDLVAACAAISTFDDVFVVTMWQNAFIARLLNTLGYVAGSLALSPLLSADRLEEAVGQYTMPLEVEIDALVLKAATVSHL